MKRKPGMGHNGPPKDEAERLFELLGPRERIEIEPFQCGAAWTQFATEEELRELAVNEARIARKKATLADMIKKRQRIMNRSIRRMRRADGKN